MERQKDGKFLAEIARRVEIFEESSRLLLWEIDAVNHIVTFDI